MQDIEAANEDDEQLCKAAERFGISANSTKSDRQEESIELEAESKPSSAKRVAFGWTPNMAAVEQIDNLYNNPSTRWWINSVSQPAVWSLVLYEVALITINIQPVASCAAFVYLGLQHVYPALLARQTETLSLSNGIK